MPAIAPFCGIRYPVRGPALSALLSPPYDVIGPAEQAALMAQDPHNAVHLVLDPQRPGDGPGDNRYLRAAHRFAAWLGDGTLRRDPRPALYPLEQVFVAPDGRQHVRRGFVAAVRLHDFREGVVLPHEGTLAAPKADRLELLKTVRANLSPVFGLYQDEHNRAQVALAAALSSEPASEADTADGVHHRLWRVDEPAVLAAVQRVLSDRRILIADGHHRYAASLGYRDLVDAAAPGLPPDAGHRWALMFLCSTSDPGLVIFPTHRAVSGLRDFRVAHLAARLDRLFRVETIAEDVRWTSGRAWAISRLAEHLDRSTAFLMVTAEDRKARLLTLRDDADLSSLPLPRNESLRALDVTVLHAAVMQGALGLSPASQERQENLTYLRDAGEAVGRTLAGEFQAAFLLNPTPLWQVEAVAESGEVMPQKSTWFHPKVPAGLVFREVDPRGGP
ncbi:MAG TPA: DUF1015 domain-containing protein [Anaeromyxobacteraceae bacterium]|nr:DUF1015 domain-containing protein [Anaeromyxobacteraceae bacterium]